MGVKIGANGQIDTSGYDKMVRKLRRAVKANNNAIAELAERVKRLTKRDTEKAQKLQARLARLKTTNFNLRKKLTVIEKTPGPKGPKGLVRSPLNMSCFIISFTIQRGRPGPRGRVGAPGADGKRGKRGPTGRRGRREFACSRLHTSKICYLQEDCLGCPEEMEALESMDVLETLVTLS